MSTSHSYSKNLTETHSYYTEVDPGTAFQNLGTSNYVSRPVKVGDKEETHNFLKLVGTNKVQGPVKVTVWAKSTGTNSETEKYHSE